jgi:xanthine dehydrogenase accessory factor
MTAPVERAHHPTLATWSSLCASGATRGALVTLVRTDGGTSRILGMHFALADDGRSYGSVTIGGCADGRALEAAQRVLASQQREELTVPLSEEDALALGLGCAGDVDLLVEPVSLHGADPVVLALDGALAAQTRGERVALATPLGAGEGRLLVHLDGTAAGSTGDAALDRTGVELARRTMQGAGAASGAFEAAGTRWFVQLLMPPRAVVIVGATEVAAALCALAAPLGWRTMLLDPRDDLLAQPRFDAATERIAGMPAEAVARKLAGPDTPAVVVVAHDYRVERPVLRAALRSDAPYVGMLGSRKRGVGIRALLAEDGLNEGELARLRTPIGLAIGAQGPAEIAVSIVAELIAVWRGQAPARG